MFLKIKIIYSEHQTEYLKTYIIYASIRKILIFKNMKTCLRKIYRKITRKIYRKIFYLLLDIYAFMCYTIYR